MTRPLFGVGVVSILVSTPPLMPSWETKIEVSATLFMARSIMRVPVTAVVVALAPADGFGGGELGGQGRRAVGPAATSSIASQIPIKASTARRRERVFFCRGPLS